MTTPTLTPAQLRTQSYILAAQVGLITGKASPQSLTMFYMGMDIQLATDNNNTVRYNQLLLFAQNNLSGWCDQYSNQSW